MLRRSYGVLIVLSTACWRPPEHQSTLSCQRWPSRLFIARSEPSASPSDNRNISLRHESTCWPAAGLLMAYTHAHTRQHTSAEPPADVIDDPLESSSSSCHHSLVSTVSPTQCGFTGLVGGVVFYVALDSLLITTIVITGMVFCSVRTWRSPNLALLCCAH